MSSSRTSFLARGRITSLVIAAFTLTLIVLTIPDARNATKTFFAQSFTHQPERLTELFFTNPHELPTTYRPEQSIPFSFTVHNKEYQDKTYVYRVLVNGNLQCAESLPLKSDVSVSVATDIPVGDYGQRAKITIELISEHESIHFWVERQS